MTSSDVSTPMTQTEKPKRGHRLFNSWTVSLFLIVIGLLVSGYLTYVKATAVPMVCVQGTVFNCSTVQNSAWATIVGVPIAYLGFAMYITMGSLFLLEKKIAFFKENGILLQFVLGLFAWLYSMWLVYVQLFLLEALCQWCLMHEFIMTILFGIICYRLWDDLQQPIH